MGHSWLVRVYFDLLSGPVRGYRDRVIRVMYACLFQAAGVGLRNAGIGCRGFALALFSSLLF